MLIFSIFVTNYKKDSGYKKDSNMNKFSEQPCKARNRALQDTLEVLSGKWKLVIIATLIERKMRFKELSREIGISPRILSKELQELELNRLVKRTVYATKPVAVEYEMTDYSLTLKEVIQAMMDWARITGRKSPANRRCLFSPSWVK